MSVFTLNTVAIRTSKIIYSITKLHGDASWNKVASRTCKQAAKNCHVAGPKKVLVERELNYCLNPGVI